ncbi:dynactin 6 [Clonorchis sinensis]|uniref:Dynactin subunit 6 n=2 Tax=Clonorchis sinensis TaxID=79923 RepID=G7YJ94_CLOSI|nr:dynactin 6 [Clonorchis sinensis]
MLTPRPTTLISLNRMDKQQPVLSSRNQARITPGAVVCSECELCGEVVIGAGTIVHPKARIVAEAGPIHIGAFNLIEEQVEIINRIPDTVLKIGDHNVFEVGARCEAMEIGDNNVFEAKSFVGPHMRITNGCVIGAMCSLMSDETLPECTVIYGEQGQRRVASERPPAQTLQLDFLTKMLPNYHHLMKASRSTAANSTLTSPSITRTQAS